MQLLLCCATTEFDEAGQAGLERMLAQPIDWQRLYDLADAHGLRPLLFRHLAERTDAAIPKDIEAKLWRHQESLRRRNRFMETELVALVRLLADNGIAAVAHKGPVVARLAYRDPALREYGDLDILMPCDEIPLARELLAQRGYVDKFPLTPSAMSAVLRSRSHYHLMLTHREHGMLVELHWKTDNHYAVETPSGKLLPQDPPTIDVVGHALPRLPDRELVLALLLHGSKHYWTSLHWLIDVAELLRGSATTDWPWMLARAEELRACRRLALGLQLLRAHAQIPLPDFVEHWLDGYPAALQLAREIAGQWPMLPMPPPDAWQRLRRDTTLCDHIGQRLRQSAQAMVLPGIAEWSRWPLPPALYFLYLPLRAGRLLAKQLRA